MLITKQLNNFRSQWPRGLRHELLLPARGFESHVRQECLSGFIVCLCRSL
jgi:hypothetical protein